MASAPQTPGMRPKFQKSPSSFYVFQPRPPLPPIYQATEFDGKRLRKAIARKTVDYNSSVVQLLEARLWQRDFRDRRALQPDVGHYTQVGPSSSPPSLPAFPSRLLWPVACGLPSSVACGLRTPVPPACPAPPPHFSPHISSSLRPHSSHPPSGCWTTPSTA